MKGGKMYKVVIQTGSKDKPTMTLSTEGKGLARSAAKILTENKVAHTVTRMAKEVVVKYKF